MAKKIKEAIQAAYAAFVIKNNHSKEGLDIEEYFWNPVQDYITQAIGRFYFPG